MAIIKGGCFCGDVTYEFDDQTVYLSAYCHCTNCQRLTAGTSVHTIHLPGDSLKIAGDVDSFKFVSKSQKHRKRCRTCGTQFASFNADKNKWSVWSSSVHKTDGALPDSLKATAHMFYGTRQFDVNDNLSKWEGYEGTSTQLA